MSLDDHRDGSTPENSHTYDIAVSFAGAQRSQVEPIVRACEVLGLRVFYDRDKTVELWGRNFISEMRKVYGGARARYFVPFLSSEYLASPYPMDEYEAAMPHAIKRGNDGYILPVLVGSVDVPAELLSPAIGRLRMENYTVEQLAQNIADRVADAQRRHQEPRDFSAVVEEAVTSGERRGLADYAADARGVCLEVRAGVVAAKRSHGELDMRRAKDRPSILHLLRQFHEVLTEGWQHLRKVSLPTVEEDLRQVRGWQDDYLHLMESLHESITSLERIAHLNEVISRLASLPALRSFKRSVAMTKKISHKSRLLGIANPLGTDLDDASDSA